MKDSLEKRFARVGGQLKKIREDIAADKDCADVIPQFLAVRGALASAFEEYVKDSLDSCSSKDKEKVKQLISILIK